MSKTIGLDLSKFKHVKSDDKSTTLKHYEGHEIKLAHNKLSKAHQEALKAMAMKASSKAEAAGDGKPSTPEKLYKGGQVVPHGSELGSQEQEHGKIMHAMDAKPYAEGGEAKKSNPSEMSMSNLVSGIKEMVTPRQAPPSPKKDPGLLHSKYSTANYAEGGDVTDEQQQPQIPAALDPNAQYPGSDIPNFTGEGIQSATEAATPENRYNFYKKNYEYMSDKDIMKQLDKESAQQQSDAQGRQAASIQQQQGDAAIIQQKQARGIPLSPAEQASMQQQPATQVGAQMSPDPGVQAAANQMQQQPKQQPNPLGDVEGMMHSGYQNQMAGIQQQSQAQQALGQQQAAALEQQVKAQTTAKATFDEAYKGLEQERQALVKDVQDGHIDPNQYWTGDKDGNGSHSKIMSGIGMILAGFNPTIAPNAAISFLKYQMDQNIQAQSKNLDSKNNLLAANLRQFGNLKDATEMTRIMQNDIVTHQLQAAAATAQTPMAKAAALQAAGQLQMQVAPQFQQFAMRRAMMGLANDPSDPTNTQAAEQMIAYARMTNPEMAKEMESRLVPGVGMAKLPIPQDARAELIGKQNFDQMAKHYVDFVKKNAGSLNPKTINAGATMAAELQGAYRNAIKGGVYKEGEQQFIEKLVPSDPTQFAGSIRTLPKLEALIQSNNSQFNQLKKGYGLPTQEVQQQSEPQIATYKGVKYQKVQGGWKPVK